MAHLIVRDGPLRGRRFEVQSGEVTIGRESTDVLIEDDSEVSRNHAVVRATDGGVEVEDLGSTNGTFVNERRISEPTRLSVGDILRVGQTRLDLETEEDPNKTIVSGVVAPPTQEHSAPIAQIPPASSGSSTGDDIPPEPAEPATPSDSQVDELPLPSSKRVEEPPEEAPDPETRQPTSELPARKKVGGGGVQRAGSGKRTLLVLAGVVLFGVVAYVLYILVAGGAPTRADYVASLNDVCSDRLPRVNGLNDGRARNTERAAALIGEMTVEIEELERPEGNDREIDRFVSTFEGVGSSLEALNVSQRANNNRRAQDAARGLERNVVRFENASRNLGTGQCTFES
ncbi:hypothetical protein BH20ACT23_BH20ACT23_29480 [soil metagenome]